jgi:hypothetical protein
MRLLFRSLASRAEALTKTPSPEEIEEILKDANVVVSELFPMWEEQLLRLKRELYSRG